MHVRFPECFELRLGRIRDSPIAQSAAEAGSVETNSVVNFQRGSVGVSSRICAE